MPTLVESFCTFARESASHLDPESLASYYRELAREGFSGEDAGDDVGELIDHNLRTILELTKAGNDALQVTGDALLALFLFGVRIGRTQRGQA